METGDLPHMASDDRQLNFKRHNFAKKKKDNNKIHKLSYMTFMTYLFMC